LVAIPRTAGLQIAHTETSAEALCCVGALAA
jgi:hypothetical protein